MSSNGREARTIVTEPTKDDVLLGRGTGPNEYEGNIRFRLLASELLRENDWSGTERRLSKSKLAKKLVEKVHARGGRFIRKLSRDEAAMWVSTATSTTTTATTGSAAGGRIIPAVTMGHHHQQQRQATHGTTSDIFIVVPYAVAVDKAKQSFRHQRRVMKNNTTKSPTGDNGGQTLLPAPSASSASTIPGGEFGMMEGTASRAKFSEAKERIRSNSMQANSSSSSAAAASSTLESNSNEAPATLATQVGGGYATAAHTSEKNQEAQVPLPSSSLCALVGQAPVPTQVQPCMSPPATATTTAAAACAALFPTVAAASSADLATAAAAVNRFIHPALLGIGSGPFAFPTHSLSYPLPPASVTPAPMFAWTGASATAPVPASAPLPPPPHVAATTINNFEAMVPTTATRRESPSSFTTRTREQLPSMAAAATATAASTTAATVPPTFSPAAATLEALEMLLTMRNAGC